MRKLKLTKREQAKLIFENTTQKSLDFAIKVKLKEAGFDDKGEPINMYNDSFDGTMVFTQRVKGQDNTHS